MLKPPRRCIPPLRPASLPREPPDAFAVTRGWPSTPRPHAEAGPSTTNPHLLLSLFVSSTFTRLPDVPVPRELSGCCGLPQINWHARGRMRLFCSVPSFRPRLPGSWVVVVAFPCSPRRLCLCGPRPAFPPYPTLPVPLTAFSPSSRGSRPHPLARYESPGRRSSPRSTLAPCLSLSPSPGGQTG